MKNCILPFSKKDNLRVNEIYRIIGLHVNAHKTEYMCFNQTGDISTLDGTSLKLVDKLIYPGSSVSSTEKDIDTRLTKAWTAIDSLSIIGARGVGYPCWRHDMMMMMMMITLAGVTAQVFNALLTQFHGFWKSSKEYVLRISR